MLAQARAWLADDPDPADACRARQCSSTHVEAGDEAASADLADRFAGMLEFGTAGPAGRARRRSQPDEPRSRHPSGSRAHGIPPSTTCPTSSGGRRRPVVVGLRRAAPAPTTSPATPPPSSRPRAGARSCCRACCRHPCSPIAIRHLGADAGVMVTASHNPPQDNGYKVYLGDGSQIVPPADALIAARIAAVVGGGGGPAGRGRLGDPGRGPRRGLPRRRSPDSSPQTSPRDVSIVHTSLHGVGDETVRAAFVRAGFPEPHVVASQASPDPDFPTVSFPNPEEAGAIDAALALAAEAGPDVVIANDPDADRCAVAVQATRRSAGECCAGTRSACSSAPTCSTAACPKVASFANSIVSSRMLAARARRLAGSRTSRP
ncbi:MAG: hypothetical protein V9F04_10465 [Dermatophilaceae bacterium]